MKKLSAALIACLLGCNSSTPPPAPAPTPTIVETPLAPSKEPERQSLFEEVLSFGEEGTNPGMFQDARSLAVASDGSIFVADYNTGRVQKFDASGKFLLTFTTPKSKIAGDNNIFQIVAGTKAQLYINRSGDVLVYNSADGTLTTTIKGDYPKTWFSAGIAVDANNKLYAFADEFGSIDLVIFDEKGKKLERRKKVMSDSRGQDIAVDSLGTMYMTRPGDAQIDIIDAKGELKSRFGSKGSKPGQLSSLGGIELDGKGRLLVENGGIDIFDTGGRYIDTLKINVGHDFTLDLNGDLYVLGSNKVTKYKLHLDQLK